MGAEEHEPDLDRLTVVEHEGDQEEGPDHDRDDQLEAVLALVRDQDAEVVCSVERSRHAVDSKKFCRRGEIVESLSCRSALKVRRFNLWRACSCGCQRLAGG